MADNPDQLARSLAILGDPGVASWPTLKKLLRAVELAARTIGRCDAAAVTLLGRWDCDGEVYTGPTAHWLEQAQYGPWAGPCLEAVRSLQIVNIGSIPGTSAWPAYRASAAENGIKSSLSVPLTAGGAAIGVLDLYSAHAHGFDGCEAAAAVFRRRRGRSSGFDARPRRQPTLVAQLTAYAGASVVEAERPRPPPRR